MKTALQIDITFEQILSLIKQLPVKQKLRLTKELEKEAIDTKLSRLLSTFKTNDLTLDTITDEVENVRQEIYDKQKNRVIFDTNVWISFLIGIRLSKIKQYISDGRITIITTEQLLTEIKTVTRRQKLKKYFPKKSVKELIELLEIIAEEVEITPIHFVNRDPKDTFLLDLIDFSRADYFGNRRQRFIGA